MSPKTRKGEDGDQAATRLHNRSNAVTTTKQRAAHSNTQPRAERPRARNRFAPPARRTGASSIYNRPRTSTFPDRRRIFPLLPTPFASLTQLIARASPHCRAHHLSSRYTAFLPLLRTAAARFATVYKESKRVNNKREEHAKQPSHALTRLRLLVYTSTRPLLPTKTKKSAHLCERSAPIVRAD